VAGNLNFEASGDALLATSGGIVQLGGLLLDTGNNSIAADDLSAIEIGTAGNAASGDVTIDSGHTLAGSGSVGSDIVDNGLIWSSGHLVLGETDIGEVVQSLAGSGTVEVKPFGTIVVDATMATDGPSFLLDGTADLNLRGSVAAGNTISLAGNSNVLSLFNSLFGPPSVAATVTGFNATDTIIAGTPGATFNQNGAIVSVIANGATVATFDLTTPALASLAMSTPGALVPCFAAGTRIATERGEVAVEHLREGDRVKLALGGITRRWSGSDGGGWTAGSTCGPRRYGRCEFRRVPSGRDSRSGICICHRITRFI
jgi:hypothetical protein